jgi:drug/metabolite transporter (DMT)-like permease
LNNKSKTLLLGILFAFIATLIWSGNYIISRKINGIIPPIHLAFYRWFLASVLLLPFSIRHLKSDWIYLKKNILYLIVSATIGIAVYNTLIYYAAHFTQAMNLTLIGATSPFSTFILASIFLKEKLAFEKKLGLVICFLGVLTLLSKGNLTAILSIQISKGDIWMMFASVLWASYTILIRKKPQEIQNLSFQATIFIIGTILLFPAYLLEKAYYPAFSLVKNLDGILIFVIFYTAIFASIIAFFSWNKTVQLLGPSTAILFLNLIPIFTSVESQYILGEQIYRYHYLALASVIIGLLISNISIFKKDKSNVI